MTHDPPISYGQLKNEIYDAGTVELLRRLLSRDSNCIDVGANRGSILRHIVEYAPCGRHFAFEPIPPLARRLQVEYPTVAVYAVALSNEIGWRDFTHVMTAHTRSGLRSEHLDPRHKTERIRVRVAHLDDVVPPDLPIRVMKVDVEGGQLGVFEGAEQTLLRWRPTIAFEHGASSLSFGTSSEMVYDFLTRRVGLAVFDLDAWLADEKPLTRHAFADESRREFFFVAAPVRTP